MSRTLTARWLLALTLVVGQWFAFAHGVQHHLLGDDVRVVCEVCAASPTGPAPAPLPPALTLATGPDRCPAARPLALVPASPCRLPPSRGPPRNLV